MSLPLSSLGLDPKTMRLIDDTCVKAQTDRALENIKNILKEAGGSLRNVVSCTLLLTNMEDFSQVNEVYVKYFPPMEENQGVPPPARACYAVKGLPKVHFHSCAFIPYCRLNTSILLVTSRFLSILLPFRMHWWKLLLLPI